MSQPDGIKQSISIIIARYRGDKSLRKFAAEISEKLPGRISHQTIKNWQDGIYAPSYREFYMIANLNDDWRRSMALELMKILRPDLHIPDLRKPNTNEESDSCH